MAVETILTNQTGSYAIDSNDSVLLAEGVVLSSSIYGFVTSSSTDMEDALLNIQGSVIAGIVGVRFILASGLPTNLSVIIGPTGSVTSGNLGVSIFFGVDSSFTINGSIAAAGSAIFSSNSSNLSIVVGATGTVNAGRGFVFQTDSDSTIINHGTVVTEGDAVVTESTPDTFSIVNTGTITSSTAQAFHELNSSGGTTYIDNSGEIRSGTGVLAATIEGQDRLVINNSGLIASPIGFAIDAGNSGDRLTNTGLITGAISLGGGDDVVSNGGTLEADLVLGTGNDSYTGYGAGVVTRTVFGGSGNDTLRGSGEADRFSGEINDDLLVGRGGDDVLDGNAGDDTILGGTGNDQISGGNDGDTANGNAGDDTIAGDDGADNLRGGRDDDRVEGGPGEDTLRGDSGDDRIVGGEGRDDMFGGSGQDVFVFETLADSGTGAARDRIYDFRSGQDTLDISQLAGPAFKYLGSANFSGSGGPEVRAVSVANGTLIYIDANGDGTRDSDIYLIGTGSVTEGDLLL